MNRFFHVLLSLLALSLLPGCSRAAADHTYTATDPYRGGMPITSFQIPASWTGSAEVNYPPNDPVNICTVRINFKAPNDAWASACRSIGLSLLAPLQQIPFLHNPTALAEMARPGLFNFIPGLTITSVQSARFAPCHDPLMTKTYQDILNLIGPSVRSSLLQSCTAEYTATLNGRPLLLRYATTFYAVDLISPLPTTMIGFLVQSAVLAPPADIDSIESTANTVIATARDNPQWVQGTDQLAMQRTASRNQSFQQQQQIRNQTQRDIADIQRSAWQNRSDSMDRISDLHSQAIRDVDVHPDPYNPGQTVESSSLYNHAWQHPDGTIFNADSVESPGADWSQLK